jgi:hypothetical protein
MPARELFEQRLADRAAEVSAPLALVETGAAEGSAALLQACEVEAEGRKLAAAGRRQA